MLSSLCGNAVFLEQYSHAVSCENYVLNESLENQQVELNQNYIVSVTLCEIKTILSPLFISLPIFESQLYTQGVTYSYSIMVNLLGVSYILQAIILFTLSLSILAFLLTISMNHLLFCPVFVYKVEWTCKLGSILKSHNMHLCTWLLQIKCKHSILFMNISIWAVTERPGLILSGLLWKLALVFSYLCYTRSSWRAKKPVFPTEMRPKNSEGPCFNEFDSRLVLLKSSFSNYLANNGTWEEELEGEKTASRSPTSHPHTICSQNLCFIIIIVIVTVTGLCFTSSSSSSSSLLLFFFWLWH